MTHPLHRFAYCPVCGSNTFVEFNEKSKHCSTCGFTYYFNPSAATVAVIINDKEQLLTVIRAKDPAKGTRDLPGGFCDCNETAEMGIAREVKEETGLIVSRCEYLFSIPNIYPYSGFDVHTMDLFFLCHVESSQQAHAMDDAAQIEWLNISSLKPEEFGLPSIAQGIKKLLKQWQIRP